MIGCVHHERVSSADWYTVPECGCIFEASDLSCNSPGSLLQCVRWLHVLQMGCPLELCECRPLGEQLLGFLVAF